MAGIGFELRKLLRDESYIGLFRAYSYASLISAGPWVLSIISLLVLASLTLSQGIHGEYVVQFQVTVTYLIMSSLILSGGLQLGFTRWASDMLFLKRDTLITSAFLGVLIFIIAISTAIGLLMAWLGFSDQSNLYRVLLVSGLTLYCCIWIATVLLASLKYYKEIFYVYAFGYAISIILVWLASRWNLEGMLAGFLCGQFLMWVAMLGLIIHRFPPLQPISIECLRPGRMYTSLLIAGLLYNIGIWIDKLIFWMTEQTSEPVIGLLRSSPIYDLPVFMAYLSIIPGMGIFLIKFETDFVEWYDKFYSAVREGGTLSEINFYNDKMQETVREGIYQIIKIQAITLLTLTTFVQPLFRWLKISELYTPLFLVQATAASFQVLLLATLNVFYYLDRRRTVVQLTAIMLILNGALTLISIQLGPLYFGYGYALASLLTVLIGLGLLARLLRTLEYRTFMLQGS